MLWPGWLREISLQNIKKDDFSVVSEFCIAVLWEVLSFLLRQLESSLHGYSQCLHHGSELIKSPLEMCPSLLILVDAMTLPKGSPSLEILLSSMALFTAWTGRTVNIWNVLAQEIHEITWDIDHCFADFVFWGFDGDIFDILFVKLRRTWTHPVL